MEFSSQRREMLLFLTTNMTAVTSLANQQFVTKSLYIPKKQHGMLTGQFP